MKMMLYKLDTELITIEVQITSQSKKETLSTYICLRQHTTDGTDRFLPYNRNVDTNANMYWMKMGTEYESDDERYEDNGVIEAVNNISAADANRKHGVLIDL